jgi:limonene-1,2-epoxide hydrolase
MSEVGILQQLGTRAVGGGGGLHQHLSENEASFVHGFAGGIVLSGFDVHRLAADGAIVFCF